MEIGTNRYRRTRVEQRRVARLHPDKDLKGIPIRTPRIDYRRELLTALIFAVVLAAAGAALVLVLQTGAFPPDSDARLMLSLGLGLVAACALASSLIFIMELHHYLLLFAAAAAAVAALALVQGWSPVESVAKIVFAACAGLWIAMVLTSIAQLLLICALVIVVDFWSVFMGPTKKMVESGGPWIDYFTINLPVFGADAVSRLGVSDIVFYCLFVGCAVIWRLRRTLTALMLAFSFVATMMIGVSLGIGVPALPLLSIFFLLTNGDLLYRRFLEEPDERRHGGTGGGRRQGGRRDPDS